MNYLTTLPAAQKYIRGADHFDEKEISSDVSLREFIAGFVSYYPDWMKFLYSVRGVFVRFLGMKQGQIPSHLFQVTPDNISFAPGTHCIFFTVSEGCEESYWIAVADDKHLSAGILIAVEASDSKPARYHVGTVVHYHNWAGPIYFNVIRPFHHFVVRQMMQAGATTYTRRT